MLESASAFTIHRVGHKTLIPGQQLLNILFLIVRKITYLLGDCHMQHG